MSNSKDDLSKLMTPCEVFFDSIELEELNNFIKLFLNYKDLDLLSKERVDNRIKFQQAFDYHPQTPYWTHSLEEITDALLLVSTKKLSLLVEQKMHKTLNKLNKSLNKI